MIKNPLPPAKLEHPTVLITLAHYMRNQQQDDWYPLIESYHMFHYNQRHYWLVGGDVSDNHYPYIKREIESLLTKKEPEEFHELFMEAERGGVLEKDPEQRRLAMKYAVRDLEAFYWGIYRNDPEFRWDLLVNDETEFYRVLGDDIDEKIAAAEERVQRDIEKLKDRINAER